MNLIKKIAFVLLIIGGLNWGCLAIGFNPIEELLGRSSITRIIYALVGISALISIPKIRKCSNCNHCNS